MYLVQTVWLQIFVNLIDFTRKQPTGGKCFDIHLWASYVFANIRISFLQNYGLFFIEENCLSSIFRSYTMLKEVLYALQAGNILMQ